MSERVTVKSQQGTLLELQPGDGTRYTLCVMRTQSRGFADCATLAIGAGDGTHGAYPMDALLACEDIEEVMAKIERGSRGGSPSTKLVGLPYVDYYIEHTGITNRWTAVVGLWTLAALHWSSWQVYSRTFERYITLLGLLYRGDLEHALPLWNDLRRLK